jgi:hypothetical protein
MNERSGRRRHTERIAELCGFKYSGISHYGGFFSVYELEQIVKKLELKVDGTVKEHAIRALANVDDLTRNVGYKKLRDEYHLGKVVNKIYECLNNIVKS